MRTNQHSNNQVHFTPDLHSSKCTHLQRPHLVNRDQTAPLQTLAHPAGSQTVILAAPPARVLNSISSVPLQPKLSLHPRLGHNQNKTANSTHPSTQQQLLHLTLSISRTSPLPYTTPPKPKTPQPKTMMSRTFPPPPPTHPHSHDLTVNLLFDRVIRSGSSLSLFLTIPLISLAAESSNDLRMM